MLVIITENLGKHQKIWYNLYRHAKCRIEANQEKRIFKEIFLTSKIDNNQKILLFYKEKILVKIILHYISTTCVFRKSEGNGFNATCSCLQSTFRFILKLWKRRKRFENMLVNSDDKLLQAQWNCDFCIEWYYFEKIVEILSLELAKKILLFEKPSRSRGMQLLLYGNWNAFTAAAKIFAVGNPTYISITKKSFWSYQDVSNSQKFRSKHSFLNLVNSRTSQFLFPKYWMEYWNGKIDSEIKIWEK